MLLDASDELGALEEAVLDELLAGSDGAALEDELAGVLSEAAGFDSDVEGASDSDALDASDEDVDAEPVLDAGALDASLELPGFVAGF